MQELHLPRAPKNQPDQFLYAGDRQKLLERFNQANTFFESHRSVVEEHGSQLVVETHTSRQYYRHLITISFALPQPEEEVIARNELEAIKSTLLAKPGVPSEVVTSWRSAEGVPTVVLKEGKHFMQMVVFRDYVENPRAQSPRYNPN